MKAKTRNTIQWAIFTALIIIGVILIITLVNIIIQIS